VEFKLVVLVYKALNNRICQTIASSLPPPGAISFDHQTISSALVLAAVHILDSQPSLLPEHTFVIVFLHMSVDLICPSTPFTEN